MSAAPRDLAADVAADFAASARDLAEAVRATAADPLDAVRILAALATDPRPARRTPLAEAAAAAVRRAALASVALACADYEPASSTEAAALTARVAGLLDEEMTRAADAGQADSYAALRDLRAAVVADLSARSAALPELVTVTLPGPLPSLAMAYRLYGDATREPAMVARAGVAHPGFMPPRFEALAS